MTWLKSQNDSPTARNGVGMLAHTTSSTSPANSRQVDSGAAGTAITMAAGSFSRSACTAANMLAPVANPSSTRMTVLPVTSSGGRSPRYADSRRISSRPSRSAMSRNCCGVMRKPTHHIIVDHDTPPAGQRANRKLLVTGCTELAHDERVQGSVQRGGHLPRDRNPTPRQAQDDDVRPTAVRVNRPAST